MRAVVESLRFTTYQGLSQRQETENDMVVNQGKFLELLQIIDKFDKTVAQKISDNPRNAKYTRHYIQNEILDIMANMNRNQIRCEMLKYLLWGGCSSVGRAGGLVIRRSPVQILAPLGQD